MLVIIALTLLAACQDATPTGAVPPESTVLAKKVPAVTAGFEFDVPVRFDSDALEVTLDLERLGSITSIPLVEIRR